MKNLILLLLLLISGMSYGQTHTVRVISETGFPSVHGFGPNYSGVRFRGYESSSSIRRLAEVKTWDSQLQGPDKTYTLNLSSSGDTVIVDGTRYRVMDDVFIDYLGVFTNRGVVLQSNRSGQGWVDNALAQEYYTRSFAVGDIGHAGIDGSGIQLRASVSSSRPHFNDRYRWHHFIDGNHAGTFPQRLADVGIFTQFADDPGVHTWTISFGGEGSFELGRFSYTR